VRQRDAPRLAKNIPGGPNSLVHLPFSYFVDVRTITEHALFGRDFHQFAEPNSEKPDLDTEQIAFGITRGGHDRRGLTSRLDVARRSARTDMILVRMVCRPADEICEAEIRSPFAAEGKRALLQRINAFVPRLGICHKAA
jgi:hypothetical protein